MHASCMWEVWERGQHLAKCTVVFAVWWPDRREQLMPVRDLQQHLRISQSSVSAQANSLWLSSIGRHQRAGAAAVDLPVAVLAVATSCRHVFLSSFRHRF